MGRIPRRIFYVCNAFDEVVRRERGIVTDVPAASKKVDRICSSLRKEGGDARVVSLGRGRQKGSWRWHPGRARRSEGIPYLYAGFFDAPVLTHLATALSLGFLFWRFRPLGGTVAIFYNPQPHYALALVAARLLGARCVLDLEDGVIAEDRGARAVIRRAMLWIYNHLCNAGAILACRSLAEQTPLRPVQVCYGVSKPSSVEREWTPPIQVHFGGALYHETGVGVFLDALRILRERHPNVLARLRFVVTGFGPMTNVVESESRYFSGDVFRFLGKVEESDYIEILRQSHVGLCLKLPGSGMGATTFPSKVVEFASYGLLVISTRVSDVPDLFPPGSAVLLADPSAEALVAALVAADADPQTAREIAERGNAVVRERLSVKKVGTELLAFLGGVPGDKPRC